MNITETLKEILPPSILGINTPEGGSKEVDVNERKRDRIKSLFEEKIEEIISTEKLKRFKGKILCNCDCPGPFCNNLVHPCNKPKEHYLQAEEAVVEIRNELRKEQRLRARTVLGGEE